jgi:Glycosyl transferase family 2
MLQFHVENWNQFGEDLRAAVEIIIVDDHSPTPALPILEKCTFPLRCYRLEERFPWNQHQCRNIGAKEAAVDGKDRWLFMSDLDIVLPAAEARKMLTKDLDPSAYYTMERKFFVASDRRRTHQNTFLVRHSAFWKVNGYDLDLIPVGGGGYGSARQFRKRLRTVVRREHMDDVVLVGYGARRRDAFGRKLTGPESRWIEDCDTASLDREAWRVPYEEALARKKRSGDRSSVNPIRTAYTRVL